MAWLYIPSMESPCVLDTAGLNSGSDSLCLNTDACVLSRGKPVPPQRLSAIWKRGGWIRRLSGLTLEPSTAARFAAEWASSLGDIPARESRSRGNVEARRTPDGCGLPSGGSSMKLPRNGAFSRTSLDTYRWDLKPSRMTCEAWAIRLRRACSRRKKSARAISGNESSFWPTPTTSQQNIYAKAPERRTDTDCKHQICLNDAVQLWPTPSARDGRDGRCSQETAEKNSRPLNEYAVTLWSSPRASDGEKGGPNMSFGAGGIPLPTQAASFPSSPQGQTRFLSGEEYLAIARSLNPLFTEWLMGWPLGWTASEVAETEWFRWKRHMRSAYSGFLSRIEAVPDGKQQESLFD